MSKFLAAVISIFIAGCAHTPPYRNDRPMTPYAPAHELIPKCKIAVQFNEDEASVPESDYLDGMFCLGLMEGILGTNDSLANEHRLFCVPAPGIKTWIAAKAVVEYAQERTDVLIELQEPSFAIAALMAKYPCNER